MLRTSAPVQFQSESNGQKLHWNSFRFCWASIVFSWWFLISSGFRDLWTGCRCTVLSSDMLKASIFFSIIQRVMRFKIILTPYVHCYIQTEQSLLFTRKAKFHYLLFRSFHWLCLSLSTFFHVMALKQHDWTLATLRDLKLKVQCVLE